MNMKDDIKNGAYVDLRMVTKFYLYFGILPWSYVNDNPKTLLNHFEHIDEDDDADISIT